MDFVIDPHIHIVLGAELLSNAKPAVHLQADLPTSEKPSYLQSRKRREFTDTLGRCELTFFFFSFML